MGGCDCCGACIGAYNACPSKSGYLRCANECIGDSGWESVEEANRDLFLEEDCSECGGDGLVNFTDEEWIAMYGVPMSEYQMTGKEPETMNRCPVCSDDNGK
jgi:hypothetical protein